MYKNNKGFTLIELLAVLSLMAIILLIAVPSITKQLSKIKENNYSQFRQNVFLAAESYINSNPDDYVALKSKDGEACINVEYLIRDGWIKSTLQNPKTNQAIDIDSSVKVVNIDGTYEYYYRTSSVCDN